MRRTACTFRKDGEGMQIDGAIFDVDGTLLDSMEIWETLGERYLRTLGIQPRENLTETFKNMSLKQAAEYYRIHYEVKKSIEEIIDGINALIEKFYFDEAELKPGVEKFLKQLDRKHVKMCIATATDRYLVEAALANCGILNYFSGILTCGEVGTGKDEPEIYESALKLLGTNKAYTVVFEDAPYALETAKRAGFPVAGVYEKMQPDQKMIKKMSDYYVLNFGDMEV